MPDTTVPALPLATSVDRLNDMLMMNDKSDTSGAAGGTGKRVLPDTIYRASIPSAAELSSGTNLQDWIDSEMNRTDRFGPIQLPSGDITFAAPLLIQQKSGFTIAGVGSPYAGYQDEASGWEDEGYKQHTRLVYTGASNTPAIRCNSIIKSRFQDFGIHHVAGGTCVEYTSISGWGSAFNLFDRIDFRGGIGLIAGETGSTNNTSDVTFSGCVFQCSSVGVRTWQDQNVCYVFNNLCYWLNCPVGIHSVRGGNIGVFGCAANVMTDCFWRVGPTSGAAAGGGGNTNPSVINGLWIDRSTAGAYKTKILDATYALGGVMLDARGIKITFRGDDKNSVDDETFVNNWYDYPIFAIPNSPAVSTINTSTLSLPSGTSITPTYIG